MVIVPNKGVDLPFEIAGQVIIVEQNSVLQGLVPALDLSLALGVIRCPTHMLDAFVLEPLGQIGIRPLPRERKNRTGSIYCRVEALMTAIKTPIILVAGSHKEEDGKTHEAKCKTVAGLLVEHGVHLLTGGGPGVMAKVSQFFVEDPKRTAGQCCLGVLPCDENDLSTKKTGYPNDWVEIPIQTHLPGKKKGVDTPKDHNSRNYINVLTAKAVIGLPGGKGTLAEIELAVEHKRPCVTFLDNEDQIEGLLESELRDKVQNVDEAKLDKFLKAVLKAPEV